MVSCRSHLPVFYSLLQVAGAVTAESTAKDRRGYYFPNAYVQFPLAPSYTSIYISGLSSSGFQTRSRIAPEVRRVQLYFSHVLMDRRP